MDLYGKIHGFRSRFPTNPLNHCIVTPQTDIVSICFYSNIRP
jgi:hypothetical protein